MFLLVVMKNTINFSVSDFDINVTPVCSASLNISKLKPTCSVGKLSLIGSTSPSMFGACLNISLHRVVFSVGLEKIGNATIHLSNHVITGLLVSYNHLRRKDPVYPDTPQCAENSPHISSYLVHIKRHAFKIWHAQWLSILLCIWVVQE